MGLLGFAELVYAMILPLGRGIRKYEKLDAGVCSRLLSPFGFGSPLSHCPGQLI